MANPEQIEQEIRAYVQEDSNLRDDEKVAYLMAIFNKHFALDKLDHTMGYYDFREVVELAKSSYAKATIPMQISKREVRDIEANYILILEAFVGYLNKHKVLRRLVKFDYGK